MLTTQLALPHLAIAAFSLGTALAMYACGGKTSTSAADAGANADATSKASSAHTSAATGTVSTRRSATVTTSVSSPSTSAASMESAPSSTAESAASTTASVRSTTSTSDMTSTSTSLCPFVNPIPGDQCAAGLAPGDICHNAVTGGGDGTCRAGVYRGGDDAITGAGCSHGNECYVANYLECLAPGCMTVVVGGSCSPVMECGSETSGSESSTASPSSATSGTGPASTTSQKSTSLSTASVVGSEDAAP